MSPQLGIGDIVVDILKENKSARNDYQLLIWLVYKKLGLVVEERVGMFKTEEYMTWESFKKAPPTETITRASRKAQEKYPELSPNWEIVEVRKEIAEEIYKMQPKPY